MFLKIILKEVLEKQKPFYKHIFISQNKNILKEFPKISFKGLIYFDQNSKVLI
jgi:hypothetical protein